jgi:hypothetical protein
VSFSVSQKTLDRLEWPEVVERLRRLARKLGLSPKGFRVDKAPAKVLALELGELLLQGQGLLFLPVALEGAQPP